MEFKKMISKEMIDFLQRAKKATFASKTAEPVKTKDRGLEYTYEERPFLYRDKYFGYFTDTGQEIVWYNGIPTWSMSYRGGMLSHEELSSKCFSFLKRCLQKFPEDFPVRGPKDYEEGDFRYENKWNGDINSFFGEEKIFWKDEQIYFRNYLGGNIK